ncbi:MAG TPA: hypothetical protein ENN28_04000 [Candidatus Uhrbacteria bacterium]|nr:hypothetical protein [Candidatus Uhrbacteria bacterium]
MKKEAAVIWQELKKTDLGQLNQYDLFSLLEKHPLLAAEIWPFIGRINPQELNSSCIRCVMENKKIAMGIREKAGEKYFEATTSRGVYLGSEGIERIKHVWISTGNYNLIIKMIKKHFRALGSYEVIEFLCDIKERVEDKNKAEHLKFIETIALEVLDGGIPSNYRFGTFVHKSPFLFSSIREKFQEKGYPYGYYQLSNNNLCYLLPYEELEQKAEEILAFRELSVSNLLGLMMYSKDRQKYWQIIRNYYEDEKSAIGNPDLFYVELIWHIFSEFADEAWEILAKYRSNSQLFESLADKSADFQHLAQKELGKRKVKKQEWLKFIKNRLMNYNCRQAAAKLILKDKRILKNDVKDMLIIAIFPLI